MEEGECCGRVNEKQVQRNGWDMSDNTLYRISSPAE